MGGWSEKKARKQNRAFFFFFCRRRVIETNEPCGKRYARPLLAISQHRTDIDLSYTR